MKHHDERGLTEADNAHLDAKHERESRTETDQRVNNKSLFVSFSGGRTSAFMGWWIKSNWQDRYENIYFLFANTGQEHEKTLEFVERCDREWNLNVVWLEAVVNPIRGKGIRHKVVDFKTASRNGEPFAAQIAKEGIPNKANPKCSDRLKLAPMLSYRRSLGYKEGDYDTAIGIRVDEVDRCHPGRKQLNLIYPLVTDVPMTKPQVYRWWQQMPFNLEIPEHYGNCVWCWHKTLRKLMTNAKHHPEWFDFPARMEKQYGHIKCAGEVFDDPKDYRTFFRGGMKAKDILELSKQPFREFVDTQDGVYTPDLFNDPNLDVAGACDESCDIFTEVA